MSLPTATPSNMRKANAQQICKLMLCSSAGDTPITMNSIALCADSMLAKCRNRFKNRSKSSQKAQNCKKHKPNWSVAVIETARDAIEFVVTTSNTQNAREVQHG
jgi:hypothetical protein